MCSRGNLLSCYRSIVKSFAQVVNGDVAIYRCINGKRFGLLPEIDIKCAQSENNGCLAFYVSPEEAAKAYFIFNTEVVIKFMECRPSDEVAFSIMSSFWGLQDKFIVMPRIPKETA